MRNALILQGDVRTRLRELEDESVHCVVTSPPYWGLRDYKLEPQVWGGIPDCLHIFNLPAGQRRARQPDRCTDNHDANDKGVFGNSLERGAQASKAARGGPAVRYGDFCACGAWLGSLGLEPTPDLWIEHLVEIFRDVRRVLRSDGTLWLNCGDAFANDFKWGGATGGKHAKGLHGTQVGRTKRYTGLKQKDLIGMPWMVAFALRQDGWFLRSDVIWHKPAPMPESVTDRPTRAHEYLFLFAKSGSPTFWTHRDHAGTRKQPKPDWRFISNITKEETDQTPPNGIHWRVTCPDCAGSGGCVRCENQGTIREWKRINLWQGHDYFYDAEAIKEPASPGTHARLAQASVQLQTGGFKQTSYREQNDFGRKSHDRTSGQILKAMAAKNGVNPKARARVTGWDESLGSRHEAITHAGPKDDGRAEQSLRDSTKFGRGNGWRERQNESFTEATSKEVVLNRNKRSVWTINSEPLKDAHYAAYPTELVRPCVMAGTSEYGCCPTCGAPWSRVLEPSAEYAEQLGKDWAQYDQDNFEGRGKLVRDNNHPVKRGESMCADYKTVGWRPTCECLISETAMDQILPCRMLDPFSGSGTTGIVALGLGRDYIGLELKTEYCILSEKRITEAASLLNRVEIRYTVTSK